MGRRPRRSSPGRFRIAPNGTWLATIGHYDRIRTDRVDTGIVGGLGQLLVGPDSTWLAVVGDDALAVWCQERPTPAVMRVESTIRSCAVAFPGRAVFVGSAVGLHCFDVKT